MAYRAVPGWMPLSTEQLYRDWAAQARSGATIVEVGVYLGRGLVFLAEALRDRADVRIVGVDHFKGSPELRTEFPLAELETRCRSILAQLAPRPVDLLVSSSTAAAATFAPASLDAVYLDAQHEYPEILADILAWLPRVKPGGWLAGDDYAWEFNGVIRAVTTLLFDRDIVIRGRTWICRVDSGPKAIDG